MFTILNKQNNIAEQSTSIFLIKKSELNDQLPISSEELEHLTMQFTENEKKKFSFDRLSHQIYIELVEEKENPNHTLEALRKMGDSLINCLQNRKSQEVYIIAKSLNKAQISAFAEGMVLSNYSFVAYKTQKEKVIRYLETIHLINAEINQEDVNELNVVLEATLMARTLVNQPVNYLNAEGLANEIKAMAEDAGAKIDILNKNKIEALKMGGLLAVNKGSIDPPTFTIFEYKPENAINEQPVVFVGKGVVYDTGGLNIKTGEFMNTMKCDMGGAAAAAGVAFAIAKAKLPLYIMALIPATDNRPGGNAYASGDVITMFDGQTVEVINTDAEGRMILADALSYAKKFNPSLVIDLATLTGAAARAIGNLGVVAMGSKYGEHMTNLKESGEKTGERIVEFPFWDEYAEQLKSEIADMVHLGGAEGGAITAGKFLEKFTDYPYIHLDIAGPAFNTKKFNYRGVGGSGVGVRLLFDFAKGLAKK
ncbi:M17 family metallopeptidase [Lentimicrobium sp. L6]|uniref:leucyl aminopeptidase family protein n=1 Tax=Lentimicrobium sp. L6 TaxID=2735916 RepID=UPI001C12E2C4|nr:M17 family peptidase N-terminal domain-containing protein [Lentimicrobium sp. L6]